jgi:hypothetical protein
MKRPSSAHLLPPSSFVTVHGLDRREEGIHREAGRLGGEKEERETFRFVE